MNTTIVERPTLLPKPKLPVKSFHKKILKKKLFMSFDKRQKFVIGVVILSFALFLAEYQFSKSGVITSIILASLANTFLYWALHNENKESFTPTIFILPFFYSLAFGLFYFLIPARIIARLLITVVYALGLYSLYLSQNIFIVASIRTIQLLSGARIVSFVIALISYFFLSNIVFSLHKPLLLTLIFMFGFSYPLVYHSLWTYTLQKNDLSTHLWALSLAACLTEVAGILWFWPSIPTVIALFLSGFFYTMLGLSHVWIEKRLFRNVLWEYVWVGVVVFFLLLLFSSWGK